MIHRIELDTGRDTRQAIPGRPALAREGATTSVAFQSEIFRPVLTRGSSLLWKRRSGRSRMVTSTL